MSDEIRKILDNKDTSDLGRLNCMLLELTTAPVGYRRKIVRLKHILLSELYRTKMTTDDITEWLLINHGKEKTTTNQAQSGSEAG